jgi:hypothetical protein
MLNDRKWREKGFPREREIDKTFRHCSKRNYNNARFPVLTSTFSPPPPMKKCFLSIIGKICFLPLGREAEKLHCDVYLKVIRQNDLVDISVSM